jgi:hypothetical protein
MKQVTCPTCRSNRIDALGRKHALYPSGCLCLIGFPLALFHQGQIPNRFRCAACDCHFTRRSALAKLNFFFLVLIASLYLFFAGFAILSIFLRS